MQDFHVALKAELFVEDSAAVVALQVVQVAGGAFDLLAHEAVEHAEVPLQAEIEQDKKFIALNKFIKCCWDWLGTR